MQICSNAQRLPRPDGNDFRPSAPDSVNQLIQRPIDERAQQSVLATWQTVSPRCSISMAVSRRAWFLSFVLWVVFCIRRRSVLGIGAMIGIAQSGWWFGIFSDWSDRINRTEFPEWSTIPSSYLESKPPIDKPAIKAVPSSWCWNEIGILVVVFVTNYQIQKYAQFVTSVTKRVLLCGLLVFDLV